MINKRTLKEIAPEIAEAFQELKVELQNIARPASETILDDWALCELLNVSKRTTANWRKKKIIVFAQIDAKIYYLYSEVLKTLEKYSGPSSNNLLKFKR